VTTGDRVADLAGAFELAADEYERGRPGYPADAVEWIVRRLSLRPGRRVLDLAAGTGKLTRLLVATGAQLIAVEPGSKMRAQLLRTVPTAETHAGSAEQIPLPDASVDAVTVAQAFHWFDLTVAVPEIARVLRRGGGLAVLWNERDEDDPVQARISEILRPLDRAPDRVDVGVALRSSGLFGSVEARSFSHRQQFGDEATFVDRFTSISYVAAAPAPVRTGLSAKLVDVAAAAPRPLTIPYLTNVYIAGRL